MTDIVRTCTQIPYYLIEYGGKMLNAKLNFEDSDDGCFAGYDGQEIKFNFEEVPTNEIDDTYICSDIATPVKITCFQTIEGDCQNKQATIVGHNCNCNGEYTAFFETSEGETLLFLETNCLTTGVIFNIGDVYNLDYYDAVTEPGCDVADKTVIVTCMKKVVVTKTDQGVCINICVNPLMFKI